MSYNHPMPTAANRAGYVVLKMPANKRKPYLMESMLPDATFPWSWTADRNKALSWPSVKEAMVYVDRMQPGWRKELKSIGRGIVGMRVVTISRKPKYAENLCAGCCVFLGNDGRYDLYYHAGKNGLSNDPFFTARWSSYAADYMYCHTVKDASNSPSFDIRLAKRLAVKRGLIK